VFWLIQAKFSVQPRLGGVPPAPKFGGAPVTNIRNTSSPHWRASLKPESRCLVPANSFAEFAPERNPATGKKDNAS
jgi:putative SOS response-associated peptidase YedK